MGIPANTPITMGGAHIGENGQITGGSAGDQKQTSTPDYSGEVSMKTYTTEAAFNKTWSGYRIIRVKDVTMASAMCKAMITACNNPNIGYNQSSRTGIQKGTSVQTPVNSDCSSLVSQCVIEGTGAKIGMETTSTLESALAKTGLFFSAINYSSYASTPPYNGDIFVKAGNHTEMVVQGHPREGNEDEIVGAGGGFSGSATEVANYRVLNTEIKTSFTPRNQMPKTEDPEWSQYYQTENGVSMNGQYAWARFSEIYGGQCDLSRGVPRTWFIHTEDKYERGMAPSLGAVMCYTNIYDSQDPGLVCIVEDIVRDYIYVSQRSTTGTHRFEYLKRTQKGGSWDLDLDKDGKYEYVFQGFIYNPTVKVGTTMPCKLQEFIETAKSQIGKDSAFTRLHSGFTSLNNSWSAAFIIAVATKVGGIVGHVIPDTFSCTNLGMKGVGKGLGTWLDGPTLGGRPNPHIGDIAFIRVNNYQGVSRFKADRAGIVVEVGSNNAQVDANNKTVSFPFKIVIGDWEGKVELKEFSSISGSFSGLFRPNWQKVDGVSEIYQSTESVLGLYTQGTKLEDAAIRDAIYFKPTDIGFEPSIDETGIKACAINYTGLLSDMYSVLIESYSSNATNASPVADIWSNTALSKLTPSYFPASMLSTSSSSNIDLPGVSTSDLQINSDGSLTVTGYYYGKARTVTMNMTPTAKEIYSLLYQRIQNKGGVIGVMANMFQETKWNPGAVNSSDGGSGLIQWTDVGGSKRCSQMKQFCLNYGTGQPFANNLSGQIAYLFHEADTVQQYKTGLEKIMKVAETEEGAVQATRFFLDYFEIGMRNVGKQIEVENFNLRSAWAKGAWELFFKGQPISSSRATSGGHYSED